MSSDSIGFWNGFPALKAISSLPTSLVTALRQAFNSWQTSNPAVDVSWFGNWLSGSNWINPRVVAGTSGNDVLTAKAHTREMIGNGGDDTYNVGADTRRVAIYNGSATNGAASGDVSFGSSITSTDLWFQRYGNALVIDVLGTHEQVTIEGWYKYTNRDVQEITADGLVLDSRVSQLVQAMATYSADHPGFDPATATQMPSDPTLQTALANAWHS